MGCASSNSAQNVTFSFPNISIAKVGINLFSKTSSIAAAVDTRKTKLSLLKETPRELSSTNQLARQ